MLQMSGKPPMMALMSIQLGELVAQWRCPSAYYGVGSARMNSFGKLTELCFGKHKQPVQKLVDHSASLQREFHLENLSITEWLSQSDL